jgi:hypothetical protein
MARQLPPGRPAGGSRKRTAVNAAKRAWPVLLEAYRRWDQLTPAQKERYRRMAADYAQRGRETVRRRRGR